MNVDYIEMKMKKFFYNGDIMDDRKILCVWKNNLVLVPFDDDQSGMYARYDEAEVIVNNVGMYSFDYGILIDDNEFQLVEKSCDGFQPSYEYGIDALKILKRLVELLV